MGRVYRNSDHRSIPVGARFIRRKLKQTEQKTDSTQVDDHHIPYKLTLPAPCFQSSADVAFFSRAFVNSLSEVPWHCDSATKSLLFVHLMANVHVMENNQQCTPAMSPRLPLIIHSLNTLNYVGLIHIVGGQRLLTMTSMASWKDYSGIWIVVSHHFSDYQIANALKSAHTDSESSITVQSWGIRYPCRHKKSNPKLKPKRKPAQRTPATQEPEPETALPPQDRLFKGFTANTDESGCTILFSLSIGTGDGQNSVIAARGTKKHAKARWKYGSDESFVNAGDKPWSALSLKPFRNATAKAGVIKWLTWLIQHTPLSADQPDISLWHAADVMGPTRVIFLTCLQQALA